MSKLLEPLSSSFCNGCPYGPLKEVLGYDAPGSDMDYAFTHGVPYAFTFEIYAGQKKAHSAAFLSFKQPLQQSSDDCFADLNPTGKEEFDDVLQRWTHAYLDFMRRLP